MNARRRRRGLGWLFFLLACVAGTLLTACGGGGSAPPPPPPLTITTTTLPNGQTGVTYSQTLAATGGIAPLTWSISVGPLPAGLNLAAATGVISGTPSATGTFNFTVQVLDASLPPQTATKALSINVVVGTVVITTSFLPAGTVNVFYSARPGVVGGTSPFTWILRAGALPTGMTLSSVTGEISGTTPSVPGTFSFMLRATDFAGVFAEKTLSINVTPASGAGALGRNDTTANATPLSNGTYQASISPLVDPPANITANPDNDIYRLTANGGAIATIEITAQRLTPKSSPLDSVIEIINAAGTRLTTCRTPANPAGPFNEPCMNDDIITFLSTDSRLEFQVPAGPPLTFFVRVLDFRGDARPDFIYTITITGVN